MDALESLREGIRNYTSSAETLELQREALVNELNGIVASEIYQRVMARLPEGYGISTELSGVRVAGRCGTVPRSFCLDLILTFGNEPVKIHDVVEPSKSAGLDNPSRVRYVHSRPEIEDELKRIEQEYGFARAMIMPKASQA